MYTKGADSIVLRRLERASALGAVVKETKKHITEYSVRVTEIILIIFIFPTSPTIRTFPPSFLPPYQRFRDSGLW
jgi:hypothetical protein